MSAVWTMKVKFFNVGNLHELKIAVRYESFASRSDMCVKTPGQIGYAHLSLADWLTCSNALVNWGNPAVTSHCASHSPSRMTEQEGKTLLIFDEKVTRFNERSVMCNIKSTNHLKPQGRRLDSTHPQLVAKGSFREQSRDLGIVSRDSAFKNRS